MRSINYVYKNNIPADSHLNESCEEKTPSFHPSARAPCEDVAYFYVISNLTCKMCTFKNDTTF